MKKSIFIAALLSLFFCLFFFPACEGESTHLNQDRIYTSYELYYNGNTDKTYAQASFKLGNKYGTLLKLGGNSSIGFTIGDSIYDPDPLTFMDEYGFYQKVLSGYLSLGVFYFTDEDGNQYTNSISFSSVTLPDTIAPIIRENSWQLSWDVLYTHQQIALKENESFTITLKEIADGDIHSFHQFEEGAESIVLDNDETSALDPGTYTLILDRRYQPELSQKTGAGGTITGRYRPANCTVEVIEE
jgi:hypothetical protein